jgi:hypothetical protein
VPESVPNREVEAQAVYDRTLGVIHTTLIEYYKLSKEEAVEAETDLRVWFLRLVRRGGSVQMPVKALRVSLLSAACQYGRSFQIWKLGGQPSQDDRLNQVLSREPQDLATDLARRLDEER